VADGWSHFVELLESKGFGPIRNGMAHCPGPGHAHGDTNPSLSVTSGADGRALVHCHAGCSYGDICAALGALPSEFFAEGPGAPQADWEHPDARYVYRDEAGYERYEVRRIGWGKSKQIRPFHRVGGRWKMGLPADVRRVPYRLPELLAGVADGAQVVKCEGERDADVAASLGCVATTAVGGAKKWRAEYDECFAGADVLIVQHKDQAGQEDTAQVLAHLGPVARRVRVVEAAVGNDLADHVAAGLGIADLVPCDGASTPAPDVNVESVLGLDEPEPAPPVAAIGTPHSNGADPPPPAGPRMDPECMGNHLLGDIAAVVWDNTGTAYAGVWATMCTTLATYLGRGPSLRAAGEHHAVLFTALVGRSGDGKGYAHRSTVEFLSPVLGDWVALRSGTGINSGEAFVDLLADEIDGERVEHHDHRLLLHEQELSRLLKVDARGGSSILSYLREAYDSPSALQTQARVRKAIARHPHVGMAVHVTPADLASHVAPADLRNGVANRVTWAWVETEEFRAFGPGERWWRHYGDLHRRLERVLTEARGVSDMAWSPEAREMWEVEAPRLHQAAAAHADPLDALMSRATSVVPRLILLLALLDDSTPAPRGVVQGVHVSMAVGIWDGYVVPSTVHIWGPAGVVVKSRQAEGERDAVESERPWDRHLVKLHEALCAAGPGGLTMRQVLHDVFGRHVKAAEAAALVDKLDKLRWAAAGTRQERTAGGAQTVTRIIITPKGLEMGPG